jgi:hypothetical protein
LKLRRRDIPPAAIRERLQEARCIALCNRVEIHCGFQTVLDYPAIFWPFGCKFRIENSVDILDGVLKSEIKLGLSVRQLFRVLGKSGPKTPNAPFLPKGNTSAGCNKNSQYGAC